MRNRTPTLLLAVLVAALALGSTACPGVQAGADPVLVNAERSLKLAAGSLDDLFRTDAQNWQAIDPVIPSWKDAVNALRVAAPPVIEAANASVKAYRAALDLRRADPTAVTQEQLNALATDLGTKIVAAVNLGKRAAEVIAQWKPGGGK